MPSTRYATTNMDTKAILRMAMAHRRVRYADLTAKLNMMGVPENYRNLANKVARGKMSANTFLLCLDALEMDLTRVNNQWVPIQRLAA